MHLEIKTEEWLIHIYLILSLISSCELTRADFIL